MKDRWKLLNGHKTLNSKTYYKQHPMSKKVVIFIHGIIEGPKQFRSLGQIAYQAGYSIYILLLPGHGGSSNAFANTDFRAWTYYVSREIRRMKGLYEEIIIVGHSMGALFALCEAAVDGGKIKALFLIDTPLVVHLKPRIIKSSYKIMSGIVKPWENYTLSEYKAISVSKTHGLGYIKWLHRYIELLSIIRYTKKQISKVNVPLFLVFADKDEFVSLKSKNYFKGKSAKYLYLMDSGHFCYNHSDLMKLEENYKIFLQERNS